MNPTTFATISRIVLEASAIHLPEGKEYLVESRLGPLVRVLEMTSFDELAAALKRRAPGLLAQVVEALTTNETLFFRDSHPFQALAGTVLPQILQARRLERRLHIWCGASSSGQEPLSIAMVVRENFPELADWDIRILATDISNEMLERCRRGSYSKLEVSRGLPLPLRDRYFEPEGARWRVKPEVHDLIEYRQLNLAKPFADVPQMDVVFLRNVLIYFAPAVQTAILDRVHSVLRPDGTLFLGTAESTLGLTERYRSYHVDRTSLFAAR